MKKALVWMFPVLAATLLLSACGGGGTSASSTPPASTLNMAGNWSLKATSPLAQADVVGDLTQNGQSLSGIMHIYDNMSCYSLGTDVPVTGTLNGNAATLTSASSAGQVLTANLTASADGSTATGTYSITGGCADGDSGQVTGNRMPSYTGTWKGTFQSANGTNVTALATLTQSGPDAHGWYQLSGPVTFQGSTCFTAGTISATSSIMAGNVAALTINTNDTPAGEVDFQGTANAAGATITGQYQIKSGACVGDSGTGTLTRQ